MRGAAPLEGLRQSLPRGDNASLHMISLRPVVSAVAGVLALAGVVSAQTTITSQQADEILKELRAIRQAVEKLQAPAPQPQAPAARRPTASRSPT